MSVGVDFSLVAALLDMVTPEGEHSVPVSPICVELWTARTYVLYRAGYSYNTTGFLCYLGQGLICKLYMFITPQCLIVNLAKLFMDALIWHACHPMLQLPAAVMFFLLLPRHFPLLLTSTPIPPLLPHLSLCYL